MAYVHYWTIIWTIMLWIWPLGRKHKWNFNKNTTIIIQQNTFEDIVGNINLTMAYIEVFTVILLLYAIRLKLKGTSTALKDNYMCYH